MDAKKQGFLQALGVTLYCSLVGVFFWKGNEVFGKINNYFGPVAFLLLFSVSVLACALIVFYKPYKLFFDGKKKEAIDTVLYTAIGLLISLLLFLTLMVLFK